MRVYNMGALYAVPNVANPTPVPIASLKGCKVGVKQAKKGFRGNQRDIIDVGDAARDWTIEIETADFRGSALQLVVPGGTKVSGSLLPAIGEQVTIAATNTVANAANFKEDGGVLNLTTGKWMQVVASAPATGQYAVNSATGVYTFAVADAGQIALITYAYATPTAGETTTVNNAMQAQSTPFKMRVYNLGTVNGATRLTGWDFFSVHFEELSMDFKVEDFALKHLKGFASQDMIGTSLSVAKYYSSEIG